MQERKGKRGESGCVGEEIELMKEEVTSDSTVERCDEEERQGSHGKRFCLLGPEYTRFKSFREEKEMSLCIQGESWLGPEGRFYIKR